MKKILIILFSISFKLSSFSQTVPILGDSTKIYSNRTDGRGNELMIRNRRKDTLGIAVNKGNGLLDWERPKQINDSTFKIGNDTIKIHNTGGSFGGGIDTAYSINDSTTRYCKGAICWNITTHSTISITNNTINQLDSCFAIRTFNAGTDQIINGINGPPDSALIYTPDSAGNTFLVGKNLYEVIRNNIPAIPGADYIFNSVTGSVYFTQRVNADENFMFYYTGCGNVSDTTVVINDTTTFGTHFGIMIAGNDLNNNEKISLMNLYDVDYVRIGIMVKQYNGSSNYMNAAEAAGKKVLLNLQWQPISKDGAGNNIPNAYVQPSEYAAYDAKVNQILTRYHDIIEVVVIENEPTVDLFFGNSPISDYIALLNHVIPVVHSHGLLIADGAIHIELVQGVMAGGSLSPNEQQVKDIIDAYPSLDLDYTNFHTHGPNQTTYTINLKNVVDYIRAHNGGKPVMSNEYHLNASYPSLIQSIVSKMKEANVIYSIPYDAGNGGNGLGISFHTIGSVELNGLGVAYSNAIALP